jgi:Arc/MetJ-type ribon-helix-helix transcriptional regulator
MEMVGELVRVGLREWLEQHYIERLERVSRVGSKDHEEDPMAIAVLDKLHRDMRSMAIKDK